VQYAPGACGAGRKYGWAAIVNEAEP